MLVEINVFQNPSQKFNKLCKKNKEKIYDTNVKP